MAYQFSCQNIVDPVVSSVFLNISLQERDALSTVVSETGRPASTVLAEGVEVGYVGWYWTN